MNENTKEIIRLSTASITSGEIAKILGLTPRYVRKVRTIMNLPRPSVGAGLRELNHQWIGGRKVDLDGYVLLETQPYRILEHRLVMEKTIGRPMTSVEVVDHIDGLTLHNDPANLRLFPNNAEHLKATITGREKRISRSGRSCRRDANPLPVDTYRVRKERGDVRLLAIVRAALQLGIDSRYLCGTLHWLQRAQIDPYSRSSLEHAVQTIYRRWDEDLAR